MCFSATVVQDLEDLGLRYHARVDVSLFKELFERRRAGEKIRVGKALEFNFTRDPQSAEAREIKVLIEDYQNKMLHEDQAELFKQSKRLADAERKLAEKFTQAAEKEKGIAERKVASLKNRIERRQAFRPLPVESRIFAFEYAPVIVMENGERVVRPFRYHCRPAGQPESFDLKFSGCYNARRDKLSEVSFWKNLFGKKHAVMVISEFFENVPDHLYRKVELKVGEKEKNRVLSFSPKGYDQILVPCLFDEWKRPGLPPLRSFALITDEPPPEVAETGHSRCPIFLKESNLEAWLNPVGKSEAELQAILGDAEHPYYVHELIA